MGEEPVQAVVVPAGESRQGCLKIGALTMARFCVHFVVLLMVVLVLVSPVSVFIRFFEQENLKLPAMTVLMVNLSYRLRFHSYIIIPALLFIDFCLLLVLQIPARPWRFLARIWFSSVLVGAFLLLALCMFAMAIPIDATLPPDQRVIVPNEPVEVMPDVKDGK